MKIIIIVGLPGSGKTHLANKLMLNSNYYLADDCKFIDIDKLPYQDLIITNPNLCDKVYFDKYITKLKERFNPKFEYIYFENDFNQCLHNALKRENDRLGHSNSIEKSIQRLSPKYNPTNVIPVFKF